MQTTVQKESAVRFGSWICEVYNWASWVNIWMIKDAELAITKLIKQFIWANAKMKPKGKLTEVKFNFNLYEIDLTTINLMDWDWTYSTIAWTWVTWETQVFNYTAKPWWLPLKDASWNELRVWWVTWVSITSLWALNVADYDLVVADWIYWIALTEAWAWTISTDYTATFDYTPLSSKLLEYWDADQTLNLQGFRFTNTDENWKIFRIEILEGYNSEWIGITFQWDEDEDPAEMAVSITAYPSDTANSTNVNLFKIYDEQSNT